jgi:cholesterol transport system auxiliary component
MKTAGAAVFLTLLCGCGALQTGESHPPTRYALAFAGAAQARWEPGATPSATTLIVNPPHAAAGFDSQHMIYLRQPEQLERFAHNEWIDTPARMLAPLIVAAIQQQGAFRAVVQTPSPATGEMRLDTEVLRLQHEFVAVPSRVRFSLRAYLVETATRRVIATREFDATAPSASEDPHGGVLAANQAVQSVLQQLSVFCAEAALNRR